MRAIARVATYYRDSVRELLTAVRVLYVCVSIKDVLMGRGIIVYYKDTDIYIDEESLTKVITKKCISCISFRYGTRRKHYESIREGEVPDVHLSLEEHLQSLIRKRFSYN